MELGWVTEPIPLTDEISNAMPLTPRFAQDEQHGLQDEKIRAIDDFKASGINDILSTMDTAVPDTLDAFLGMATYYSLIQHEPDLLAFTADFPHAYKHVGIPVRHAGFATIILAPPSGPLHVATLRTQPFGSSRAPANWGRVTRFIQFILERIFGVVIFVYVDDCFCIEVATTVQSALKCFTGVCELFGFSLSPTKSQGPTKSLQLMGAELSIFTGHVSACLPERRRIDLINDLKRIITFDQLNPAQAAKLRGRLGFAQSLLFGRVGRALLQPLTDRQYARSFGRKHPLLRSYGNHSSGGAML